MQARNQRGTRVTWRLLPDALDSPDSPCIKQCRIDEATGYCAGCWRSLAEIASWSAADAPNKRLILAAVAQRRARSDPDVGLVCNCADD